MKEQQTLPITVIGSINMDLVGTSNQLPRARETLSGTALLHLSERVSESTDS